MSSHPSRPRQVFVAAVNLPAEERNAYIAEACGEDHELRRRVRDLLDAHEKTAGFLESPAPDLAVFVGEPPIMESPGTVIGPYKLLEEIGEGGMGLVFVADQEHPVRRKVALKVIKPGLDTRQVIARFEAERQALALMDHRHVARGIDAGATESGRPYFVMELIRGVPITLYCDQCNLSTGERLELFVQVCHGVQHAHQKGIIHRDVKPSNVLVAIGDGRPVAKVIDFGVAKAIHQRLTERTLQTGHAQVLGTPLYMSPEQAEMSPLAVDTRTDIYSLGVLLYELLTGTTPIEGRRLGEASFDEVRRVIRDVEPPTPSTRISTLGERARALAERRRIEIEPGNAEVHYNLGFALLSLRKLDEAVAAYRKTIELDPGLFKAHVNLGAALHAQGKLDDAVAALRKSLELKPEEGKTHVEAYHNLGVILSDLGNLGDAIAAFRKALELKPEAGRTHAETHQSLGSALGRQGKLEEAIVEYQRAIQLEPDRVDLHCRLGDALRDSGKFAEALLSLKRCHELGSRRPRWPYPSAEWIAECEKLIALDGRLPRVLTGEDAPADGRERIAFADLCYRTRRFDSAARFLEEAFAADPGLMENASAGHRYNAACAAALAGAGGEASPLDGEARARRRAQAREWLRADLAQQIARLEKDAAARADVAEMLRHWLRDPDLKGLRHDGGVTELPREERQACDNLWRDVENLLRRAEQEKP